jgi:amino acid transporter
MASGAAAKGTTGQAGRTVGLLGAVAIGIGGMVGGGIFAVLGVVATQAGGGTPLALLVAGCLALLTATSYAELSRRYPSRGGSIVFIDRVFRVGTLTGTLNNLLWFGYLVTLALYAYAFANYAATFIGSGDVPAWLHHVLISLAILVPTGLNLLSAGIVARTETAIVGLKLVMLLVVVGAGLTTIEPDRLVTSTWPSLPVIVAAGMLVFVAYEGFELIANAAEDVRSPARTVPLALLVSVGVVVVIYVAVAVVTVGSLDPGQIAAASDFALAEASVPSLGQAGFVLVAAAAVLATLSAINATLYGAARLSYAIAVEGELPPVLERRVWDEPVGLLVTAAVALVLANLLELTAIAAVASAVFLAVFAAVDAAAARVTRGIRRVIAATGAIGCLAALVVLVVDTAGRTPAALIVLVVVAAVAGLGELIWLRHRRTVGLATDTDA